MAKRYCVFWYPTIFHTELELVDHELFFYESHALPEQPEEIKRDVKRRYIDENGHYIIEADMCDTKGSQHHVVIKLNPQTQCLDITAKSDKRDNPVELTLTPDGTARRNGLVIYSYDLGKTPEDFASLEAVLHVGVYHLSKSFFHVHELKNGGDSVLHAHPLKEQQPELDKADNSTLLHFLQQYEKKFIGCILVSCHAS